jgi:hypothetical protein
MLHLSHLLNPLQKHHPEVVSDFIEDYCYHADIAGDRTYHFGWGSLKWALCHIAERQPDDVVLFFFNILCEAIAKDFDSTYFETGILKFHCIKNFKTALREIDPIDVTALPWEMIGKYKVMINTTPRQLASPIMKLIPSADLIVSAHQGLKPTVSVRQRRGFYHALFEEELLDVLGTEEAGWSLLRNMNSTTIVNNLEMDFTVERILKIITPVLLKK